jgi:hypothetical protein
MADCDFLIIGDTNPDPNCQPPNRSASETTLIRDTAPPGGGPEQFPVLHVENQRDLGFGILGRAGGASGFAPAFPVGVWADAATGNGVFATSLGGPAIQALSENSAGVLGTSNRVADNPFGAWGVCGVLVNRALVLTLQESMAGVLGTSADRPGVVGESRNSHGVLGVTNNSGPAHGVVGENRAGGIGILGLTRGGSPAIFGSNPSVGDGVSGFSNGQNGVSGSSRAGGITSGVYGEHTGGGAGVFGRSIRYPAVYGEGPTQVAWPGVGGVGRRDNSAGVVGWGSPNFQNTIGIHGISGPGPKARAALFEGTVETRGRIIKRGGGTQIDHPRDPENKYLNHFFVESDEMKNVYDGVVQLDQDGAAWVELPEWFETYNRDYRYHLTAIGRPAPELHIAEEIAGNWFRIAGGTEGLKVSWQVTGVRQDRWAEANRVDVEEYKADEDQGRFIYPELYDAPEEQRVVGPLSEIPEVPGFSFERPEAMQQVDELGRPLEEQRQQADELLGRAREEQRQQVDELGRAMEPPDAT